MLSNNNTISKIRKIIALESKESFIFVSPDSWLINVKISRMDSKIYLLIEKVDAEEGSLEAVILDGMASGKDFATTFNATLVANYLDKAYCS